MNSLARRLTLLGTLALLVACVSTPQVAAPPDSIAPTDCHPAPDLGSAQSIVGYGSLMQDDSRRRTSPHAGPAHPVEVRGFQRRWIARGDAVGFSTTYLGVTPDNEARMNAVIYRVEQDELSATDQREQSYCRVRVPADRITSLERSEGGFVTGEAWIYVNKPGAIATPTARYPIVESYVDIFVAGCLEQEQRFGLEGFAQQCIATTHDWSVHWVNDRIHPRRPFIHQPKARQIDALLARMLPEYFGRIRIE